MNKSELVEQVAGRAGLSHGQAAGAVEATLAAIEAELAAGREVAITGFGRFSVAARSARQARNPRTGEPIEIPPGRVPRFSAGDVQHGKGETEVEGELRVRAEGELRGAVEALGDDVGWRATRS